MTGVAYSLGPEWAEPKTLQHWPPKILNELANKVPSQLKYDTTNKHVQSWGFLCESDNNDTEIVDCFKLHLDPEYADPRPDAPSSDNARRWYKDYLRSLHEYISETFSNSFPRWGSMPVEFIFSVPTTWKNPSMIADIVAIIRSAGFGSDGPEHRVEISLTEAEAAAVYAAKQQMEKDDIILVCDAGGGTTDVNTLKVKSKRGTPMELAPLSWTEGRPIGSTLIDIQFHRALVNRLDKIRNVLRRDPVDVAHEMMTGGRFERMKCSFGTAASLAIPTIQLQVPGMPEGFEAPEAHVEDSKMVIQQAELKALFDGQIDRMLDLIEEQLQRLEQRDASAQVSHLVLSGGLGSSPYVRQRLKSYFETGRGSSRPNAQDIHIVTVAEPQLAVVHGLVLDRVQLVKRGEEIFKQRCCGNSYGVKCLQIYNPRNVEHTGKEVFVDKRDGKKYVENQIDWFVKRVSIRSPSSSKTCAYVRQGDNVSSDGILKPYRIKIKPGMERNRWTTIIVMSSNEREKLPTNLSQDGAKRLCMVESSLKDKAVDTKIKNRHWYNLREKYLEARVNIQVVLGPADLKFQLQSKDREILSNSHDAIQVKWDTAEQPNIQVPHRLEEMYIVE